MRDILILEQGNGCRSFILWKATAGWVTSSSPLELVNVEGEFEGGAELQAHIFHHHVTTQQQECFAVNLLQQMEEQFKLNFLAKLSFKSSLAKLNKNKCVV